MDLPHLVSLAINASMFLLVLTIGLSTVFGEATYLLRHPGLLFRSLLAMNVLMVPVALLLIVLLDPAPEVRVALMALSLSPVPPILPTRQLRYGGRREYTISLLCAAAIASIALVPLGLRLLSAASGVPLRLSPGEDAGIVMFSVIVPLVVGTIIRRLAPGIAEGLLRPLARLASIVLFAAVIPLLVVAAPVLWKLVGEGLLVALVAFTLVGLAIGHWLGGPLDGDRTVLAFATGTRHPGVAIAIVSLNFPDLRAAFAVVLLHLILSVIVTIPYMWWRQRGHQLPAAVGDGS